MEISSANPVYDDYIEEQPPSTSGTQSNTAGFRETHVLKNWSSSDSKQYIVGPPQFENGRVIRLVTCMMTSRQMEMIEQNESTDTSTEEGDDILVFVTETGEHIVLRSENTENSPDDKPGPPTPEADAEAGGSALSAAHPFDIISKGLYGRI